VLCAGRRALYAPLLTWIDSVLCIVTPVTLALRSARRNVPSRIDVVTATADRPAQQDFTHEMFDFAMPYFATATMAAAAIAMLAI
jgi:hypothetical protein